MNIFSTLIIACAIFSICSAKAVIICKPSSTFKNDCNICTCALTGLYYTCSEDKCYSKKTNKEISFKDEFDNDYNIDLSNENYDDDDYVNGKNNEQVASEALDMEKDTNDVGDERFGLDDVTNDIGDEIFVINDENNDDYLNNDSYDGSYNFNIAPDNDQYHGVGINNEEDDDDFNELRSRAWDKILRR